MIQKWSASQCFQASIETVKHSIIMNTGEPETTACTEEQLTGSSRLTQLKMSYIAAMNKDISNKAKYR